MAKWLNLDKLDLSAKSRFLVKSSDTSVNSPDTSVKCLDTRLNG
uniref:Uncharacterized protein n=1 Tax=Siphoviridae sp. cthu813 TaxID=2825618 RepID=A0A8S5VIB6_9CAUD|nr:MAG TPA: hypothetical protein [Siphoviridae sp. cthu813]